MPERNQGQDRNEDEVQHGLETRVETRAKAPYDFHAQSSHAIIWDARLEVIAMISASSLGSPLGEDEGLQDHPVECESKHDGDDPIASGSAIGRQRERKNYSRDAATNKNCYEKEWADYDEEVAARALAPTMNLRTLNGLSCLYKVHGTVLAIVMVMVKAVFMKAMRRKVAMGAQMKRHHLGRRDREEHSVNVGVVGAIAIEDRLLCNRND